MAGIIVSDFINKLSQYTLEKIEHTILTLLRSEESVTLTNFENTERPAITAGSKIEAAGGLFDFKVETEIEGDPDDGECYIKLIPYVVNEGTVDETIMCRAEFTTEKPVWSDNKQGRYSDVVGEENQRYLPFVIVKKGDVFVKKYLNKPNLNNLYTLGNCYNFDTVSGNILFDNTSNKSQDFYLHKPVCIYMIARGLGSLFNNSMDISISIYQNNTLSEIRKVHSNESLTSLEYTEYNILLLPGKYRITLTCTSGCARGLVYISHVFGESSINNSDNIYQLL